MIELALLLLNLVGGISGLYLAWKNYHLQADATKFDDTLQLLETYRQEIERLRQKCEHQEKRLGIEEQRVLQARHAEAVAKEALQFQELTYQRKLDEIARGVARYLREHPTIQKGE